MPKRNVVMTVPFDRTKAPYKQHQRQKKVPELQEISPEELIRILEEHKKWLESEDEGGKARLHKANLQKANLQNANLQQAYLGEANLQEANLQNANLQQAYLRTAQLRRASLNGAILREANFQNTDLTDATGLRANQFAGANVSGAKLPQDISKFEGLGQVEKISQRAQKLFLSLFLGCLYCWLTIATTTDVALITNSGSSPLPIIQTQIPIAGFYWTAPLILLGLYIWFHLYLQRLWERLSQLPAVFTDGEALDEKVYPWLISGMVRSHVRLLKEHRPALSRIQTGISILLAWWLVPFTFLFFWLRYIPRHEWVGTSLHIGVLALSITGALLLYLLAGKTLRGERSASLSWKEKVKSLSAYQHASLTLGILGLCAITFWTLSTRAFEGVRPANLNIAWDYVLLSEMEHETKDWKVYRPIPATSFGFFEYWPHANLVEAEISTKPGTWTGQKEKLLDEIPLVKGANLQNTNLQNANLLSAFLIKVDLREANLQEANLQNANLQEADLAGANLQEANLAVANLYRAILFTANLQEADLAGANLQEADLRVTNLQEARLYKANLQNARLKEANLRGVNLTLAKHLTQLQLNQACVDERTKLPEGLKRPEPCKEEKFKN